MAQQWIVIHAFGSLMVKNMRILVADRQHSIRNALSILLDRQPGWIVVGLAEDTLGLLSLAAAIEPDVILLDWQLNGLEHAQLLSRLRRLCPRAVILAMSGRPEMRQDALLLGVDAFVSKIDPPARLLDTIQSFSRFP